MLFREQDVDKSDPCIDAIRRIDAQHPIRNVIADEDERLEYDSLFWELSTYALLSVICLIATTCIAALPALVAWIIIEVAKLHVSHLATSYIMLILGSLGAIWFQISYVYGGYREAMQYANALRTVEEQYEKMRP